MSAPGNRPPICQTYRLNQNRGLILAQFLGLNILPGSFILGHMGWGGKCTPGCSSGIRHRNQLTTKAWEKAVQELGKLNT